MHDRADADRIRAFRCAVEDGVSERREPLPWGTALYGDSTPNVYDVNFLRAEGEPRDDAAALAADADDAQAHLFHRKIVVDAASGRLEQGFRNLGWSVSTHLVMALRRRPDKRVDTSTVQEVSFDDLREPRRASTLSEPWGDEQISARLAAVKGRVAEVVPMRHFAVLVDGKVAAYCELRSGDGIAQIEDVNTLESFRGRGLGRALVQRAQEEAGRTSDLVFLEALEEDWPRHLYERLGFDTVDRRHHFLRLPHALTGLKLRTPRLELRLGTRAELRALADVARAGIHPPDEMPFLTAWTDRANEPGFIDFFVEFHETALHDWSPEDWALNLLAFHDGQVVGTQGVGGERFATERTVASGSWLGQPWQGRGLGTEMRAAVLELAFRGLGAREARTGAFVGNTASMRVSEKLGYLPAGEAIARPRGEPVRELKLVRHAEGWQPPVPVEIDGLDPLLPLFGASAA